MSKTSTKPSPKTARRTLRKSARLEARVSLEEKELFARAAALQGRGLTDFLVSSAQAAAVQVIRDYALIELDAKDQQRFAQILNEPPAASQRLRAAAKHYRQHHE